MILGVTGGSGGGKSTLSLAARELGFLVIDCDRVYHELLKTSVPMLEELRRNFPSAFEGGALNRKALGAIVFHDDTALQRLNAITHPYVRQEVQSLLVPGKPALIEAIALFESGLAGLCDRTVYVTAPRETRVRRLMARDGISEAYARSRIEAQKSDAEFEAMADFTLSSDFPYEAFLEKCKQFLKGVTNMEEKKYEAQRKAILAEPKNGYDRISDEDLKAMEAYCKEYMEFISNCKMEREAVDWTIALAEKHGFKPLVPGMELKPGDRVYGNNHKKSVIFAVIGSEGLDNGVHICGAHIDSPRLDLKPNPLYEDSELAYFKTHYYGGIKKYQWTTIPLAIHGVVAKKDGSVVKVTIGEDPADPIFCVTDLLVHLSGDQMKKTLAEGVTGENLNILLGSRPLKDDEGSDRVKFAVMSLLIPRLRGRNLV